MSEKEFLERFTTHIGYNLSTEHHKHIKKLISSFLEEHHAEYYEVEFVNIEETENAFSSKGEELEAKEGIKGWDI